MNINIGINLVNINQIIVSLFSILVKVMTVPRFFQTNRGKTNYQTEAYTEKKPNLYLQKQNANIHTKRKRKRKKPKVGNKTKQNKTRLGKLKPPHQLHVTLREKSATKV